MNEDVDEDDDDDDDDDDVRGNRRPYARMLQQSVPRLVASPGAAKPPPSHPQFDETIASSLKGGDGSGCAP